MSKSEFLLLSIFSIPGSGLAYFHSTGAGAGAGGQFFPKTGPGAGPGLYFCRVIGAGAGPDQKHRGSPGNGAGSCRIPMCTHSFASLVVARYITGTGMYVKQDRLTLKMLVIIFCFQILSNVLYHEKLIAPIFG